MLTLGLSSAEDQTADAKAVSAWAVNWPCDGGTLCGFVCRKTRGTLPPVVKRRISSGKNARRPLSWCFSFAPRLGAVRDRWTGHDSKWPPFVLFDSDASGFYLVSVQMFEFSSVCDRVHVKIKL